MKSISPSHHRTAPERLVCDSFWTLLLGVEATSEFSLSWSNVLTKSVGFEPRAAGLASRRSASRRNFDVKAAYLAAAFNPRLYYLNYIVLNLPTKNLP
jgi:hypothetical protein